ncbi:hypothetical protein K8R32_02820 [bacterium]|nr:hypothetical protein [bacterium]
MGPEKIQAIVSDIEEVNSLFLKTDYAEHEVYLLAYLEDVYTNSMKKDFVFEDMMPQSDYVISTKEVKISKAHTDSVLDSYRIEFKDRPYYIIFDIVSDQEPPADLNHIWDPDHNVKDEDILQILKSLTTSQTVTEELASKFKSTMPDVDIKFQKESFLWWNDEDGYSILVPGIESIEISKDDGARVDNFTKSSFVRGLLEIVDQVMEDRDFSLNEKNTSIDETDKKFYDYVRAFENSEELCVVRVNPDYSSHGCADNMFMCNEVEITCGNDLVGSQTEQRPFLEALDLQNKEKIIRTRKQIGDYFQLGVSGRRAGSEAVMKKEDSGLRLIYMSQEDPLCELLDKEKIPSNVLSSFKIEGCWTETGYRNIDE